MPNTRRSPGSKSLKMLLIAAALLTTLTADVAAQNGYTAVGGSAITGGSTFDAMWSDSGDSRWKVSNHGASPVDLAVWPCGGTGDEDGIVYAGPAVAGVFTELCLPASSTIGSLMRSGNCVLNGSVSACTSGSYSSLNGLTSMQQFNFFQNVATITGSGVGLGYGAACSPSAGSQTQTHATGNCGYRNAINKAHGYGYTPPP